MPVSAGSSYGRQVALTLALASACGDAGIAASHALVLVNHGKATGAQLLDLARRVAGSVQARFGVALEPEPRIIGATW